MYLPGKKYMGNNIKTRLSLLVKKPKDYIYCLVTLWLLPLKYSSEDKLRIYPYDPESKIRAQELIDKINKLCPDLEIHLIGSVGLQIEGRGDIDLYAVAPSGELARTFSRIRSVYGKPVKTRKTFAEWKFRYSGYLAELHVASPDDREFHDQMLLFELLKNNHGYLDEYRNLKIRLNNCPMREYVSRRMEFFNRILA
jgi:GrpB-like predicted nucleotidyltransferase (UPF0157 family)